MSSDKGGARFFDDHRHDRGWASQVTRRITPRAMRRTFQDLARNADIETIVRQKICGHALQEMSELYTTVPQREIQAAVGAWESGGKEGKGVFLWALKGLNLRLPPCEGGTLPLS
jgi:integrase